MTRDRLIAVGLLAIVAIAVGGILPDLLGAYLMRLVNFALIYSVLALGLNLTLGFRGELSLGHQTFFGIGAYAAAIIAAALGFPLLALLPVSALFAGIAGFGIGLVALRTRGPYFAIVTLSFGVIAEILANNLVEITNGPMGISGIGAQSDSLLGWPVRWSTDTVCYEILVILVCLTSAITYALRESRFGRGWRALRDHEDLAAAIGIPAFRMDLLALVLSAAICGAAGAVYAFYTSVVAPDDVMSFGIVIMMLVSVVVGGRGTIAGPILGAFIFALAPEYLRIAQEWRLPIFGFILMLLVILAPRGVIALIADALTAIGGLRRIRGASSVPGRASE